MKKNPSKKQLREFGFLFGLLLPFFVGFLIPFLSGHSFRWFTFWISLPILLLGITCPKYLKKPYFVWMMLGDLLGWLNSRIILGIVFILILQPISFLMKLFGYDPLRLKKSKLVTFKEYNKDKEVDFQRIF